MNEDVSGPMQERLYFGLKPATWTSVGALVIALGSVAWQAWDWVWGPEITLLPMDNEVVNFQCPDDAEDCFGEDADRLSIVAPVFLYNHGAPQYSDMVDEVQVSLEIAERQYTMYARDFSRITEDMGERTRSRPFHPIIVPGQKSGGEEVRFTTLRSPHLRWPEFLKVVGEKSDGALEFTVRVHSYEDDAYYEQVCEAELRDVHVSKAERMLEKKEGWYISTTCA